MEKTIQPLTGLYLSAPVALTGAAAGMMVRTPVIVWYLVGFIGLDFATGVLAAIVEKNLSSAVSYRGLTRKVMILVLVGAAYALKNAMGLQFDLGATVASAYIVNEVISLVENCARVGVPIPAVVVESLAKFRSTSTLRAATPQQVQQLELPLENKDGKSS